jgi:hypothetical protein
MRYQYSGQGSETISWILAVRFTTFRRRSRA